MSGRPAHARARNGDRRNVALPVVIAVVAALVALVMATAAGGDSGDGSAADATREPATPDAPAWQGPEPRGAGPLTRGDADAPVVMVMYSEFQCPFCGKFARDTEPELVSRFVEEGTLRIEWRDLPYLGPESLTAAVAGRAAADQDAFWAFAERLYADQPRPNSGTFTEEHLVGVADSLGLDADRFRAVMRDEATAAAVRADVDEAVGLGVTGTPAFFVNGEVIMGAQPTEVFVDAIERAAAR